MFSRAVLVPLTKVPFWYHFFEPLPFLPSLRLSRHPGRCGRGRRRKAGGQVAALTGRAAKHGLATKSNQELVFFNLPLKWSKPNTTLLG